MSYLDNPEEIKETLSDEEVLNHLRFFEEFGYIEFVRFRGIRLKFEVVQ